MVPTVLAMLVAAGGGLLVAAAPDQGWPLDAALRGLLVAVVIASPAIGSVVTRRVVSRAALAGGTVVAGAVLTPGGNLLGVIAAAAGVLLLFATHRAEPVPGLGLVAWTIADAGLVYLGVAAALWSPAPLLALAVALVLVLSGRFPLAGTG